MVHRVSLLLFAVLVSDTHLDTPHTDGAHFTGDSVQTSVEVTCLFYVEKRTEGHSHINYGENKPLKTFLQTVKG